MSPPLLDVTFEYSESDSTVTYSIDDICSMFCVLRIYAFLPLFKRFYIYMHPSANPLRKIVNLSSSHSETKFAIISSIKQYPYIILPIALGCAVVLFATELQIAERSANLPLVNYSNNLWLLIVSMATSKN